MGVALYGGEVDQRYGLTEQGSMVHATTIVVITLFFQNNDGIIE